MSQVQELTRNIHFTMEKKMLRLMGEIKRRKSHLKNDSEPDELHMRMCMGKTILLMKHLRETFVESVKYCELVRSDASTSLHKCRQHMVFLYRIVPCNDGGGKLNHEVRRGFHQVMDAVLLELGHFIRDSSKTQNSRNEVRMGLQNINQNLMLLGNRAEREAALRRLKSELDASQNDGGDAIKQYSPKWSDLITKLSGKMKKTHQSPRQVPDCQFMWRQPSESCWSLNDKSSLMDLRESDKETPTCMSTESWEDTLDSGNITQTGSTSTDSLFRSEVTLTTSVSEMTFCDQLKNTHQSPRQIPDWNVNCRQLSEPRLNLTENLEKTSHMDPQPESKVAGADPIQTLDYQKYLVQVYKPIIRRSTTSLDPSFLRETTPVSVAIPSSLPKIFIKPKRPPSTPSHFSLGKTFGDKRLRLLRWCKQRTRSYGLPMYEFSESWTSGRALVALMHSYHKDLIEHRFLYKESPQDTLTYGAELAKSLGVDCEVDIVQVCLKKKPDFCKVFQFVRELRRCLDHR